MVNCFEINRHTMQWIFYFVTFRVKLKFLCIVWCSFISCCLLCSYMLSGPCVRWEMTNLIVVPRCFFHVRLIDDMKVGLSRSMTKFFFFIMGPFKWELSSNINWIFISLRLCLIGTLLVSSSSNKKGFKLFCYWEVEHVFVMWVFNSTWCCHVYMWLYYVIGRSADDNKL